MRMAEEYQIYEAIDKAQLYWPELDITNVYSVESDMRMSYNYDDKPYDVPLRLDMKWPELQKLIIATSISKSDSDLKKYVYVMRYKSSRLLFDLFTKRCPDIDADFQFNCDRELFQITISKGNDTTSIMLSDDTTWKSLANFIKFNMLNNDADVCGVCYEESKEKLSCGGCSKCVCVYCYVNMIREGRGIVRCAFCRCVLGRPIAEDDIDMKILSLADNYGLKIEDLIRGSKNE